MLSVKLLMHLYNFFLKYIYRAIYIKLGDLYLSKEESKDIIELLAKKRNIKNYKSKSSDRLYNIFKKQSKNKKRIDGIREELKNPKHNISKK